MLKNAFVGLALAFLTGVVFAQQAPGEFQSPRPKDAPREVQREREPATARPGEFEESESPATEISRLKTLSEAQVKKISLLEAKIKLLEMELQNQRGANR